MGCADGRDRYSVGSARLALDQRVRCARCAGCGPRDLDFRISDFSKVEQVMKCIVILAALVVAAFCIFGFAATFEPLDRGQQLTGRAVYGAGFLASIVVVAWTLVKGRRARSAGR